VVRAEGQRHRLDQPRPAFREAPIEVPPVGERILGRTIAASRRAHRPLSLTSAGGPARVRAWGLGRLRPHREGGPRAPCPCGCRRPAAGARAAGFRSRWMPCSPAPAPRSSRASPGAAGDARAGNAPSLRLASASTSRLGAAITGGRRQRKSTASGRQRDPSRFWARLGPSVRRRSRHPLTARPPRLTLIDLAMRRSSEERRLVRQTSAPAAGRRVASRAHPATLEKIERWAGEAWHPAAPERQAGRAPAAGRRQPQGQGARGPLHDGAAAAPSPRPRTRSGPRRRRSTEAPMRLYVMRHGSARIARRPGGTSIGASRRRARGVRRWRCPGPPRAPRRALPRVISSPRARALETATIVVKAMRAAHPTGEVEVGRGLSGEQSIRGSSHPRSPRRARTRCSSAISPPWRSSAAGDPAEPLVLEASAPATIGRADVDGARFHVDSILDPRARKGLG